MTNLSAETTSVTIAKPTIAIIGTGALACIFAARLSACAHVQIIGSWRSQIDAINASGLTIHEIDGSCSVVAVNAVHYANLSVDFVADFVVVLVKSYQTRAAIARVKSIVRPKSVVLTLQNGLGNIEQIKSVLPDQCLSAGTTLQGANITDVGNVVHAGNGTTVIDDQSPLRALVRCFEVAGIPTVSPQQAGTASIDQVIWRKLIINTAVNPLTALLGMPNGFLADDRRARQLSEATALETLKIAVQERVWGSAADLDAKTLVTDAARVTAENRSSMLQDISRGSRTEIEAMCGEVVARAEKSGQSVPLNQLWLKLVAEADQNGGGSAGQPLFNIDELVRITR